MNNKILVSGLVNLETTCSVRQFPIEYAPIDYNFFGVSSSVSGVGMNIAKALCTLGHDVDITTLIGSDTSGDMAVNALNSCGVSTKYVVRALDNTAASVVLYDGEGRRRIYCDLKDIQDRVYDYSNIDLREYSIAAVCNINFSRPLLHAAKSAGIPIATDVHVLGNINDDYNREFMENANILFLSDEALPCEPKDFMRSIEEKYGNEIIVMGRGSKGALMYLKSENDFYDLSSVQVGEVVNTVGAGDSLFSAFISSYAAGYSPVECLKRAEIFASAKIRTSGAALGFVSNQELDELYKQFGDKIIRR